MAHTAVTRLSAFTFAAALTFSVTGCDTETIQPSEENPMSEPADDDAEDS